MFPIVPIRCDSRTNCWPGGGPVTSAIFHTASRPVSVSTNAANPLKVVPDLVMATAEPS